MAKLFADRAFIEANGFELVHLITATLTRTRNLTRKETMTRNRRTAGFTEGNLGIQITGELAIERNKAQFDTFLKDPDTQLNMVFVVGGDRYTVKDIEESDMNLTGSVGDASKSFTWEGLDLVNDNGTSVNFDISLG